MGIVPVIQCILLMVYTVIYVNIWPIRKSGTAGEYKAMSILSGVMVVIMLITSAPIQVVILFVIILVKDLILMWFSG